MHVLVVNDDGPPSSQSSPYVHSLVKTLQATGHVVSVVLPHTQRSWIGKAHIIGQTVKPTYFRPGTLHSDEGTTHSRPLPTGSTELEEWVLVDGTPASCVQIGLYHYFHDRGPVDLVVSGPNYGRNSTAVFSLSSGTLGGALEAAVCKRRSIALSYAFFSRNHDPEIIAGASELSVRLIEYLSKNWGENVDLYSVNIPLVENVGKQKVLWTNMLQNYWGQGSCFQEVEDEDGDADEEEQSIRKAEGQFDDAGEGRKVTRHTHKHFKWAPRFTDVYKSVEEAPPGNDGWAVQQGFTSVTPLKANFMHAVVPTEGELKLSSLFPPALASLSISRRSMDHFFALIHYEDDYVQPLILAALKEHFPENSYTLIKDISELPEPSARILQIGAYECLSFEHIMAHPTSALTNAYVIRKALIRKHYLATTASHWITKNPHSILATSIPPACEFELDYAEFLDDAILEAWELHESFRKNAEKPPHERDWWILKPGMSDRGAGIRLFSTAAELQAIFEAWEAERPESDGEVEEESATRADDRTVSLNSTDNDKRNESDDYIVTSHLRHFTAQPYIHPPLLVQDNPRKFHIRTYVLAVGCLKVYVYDEMLALFAASPYTPPWISSPSTTSPDLSAHLTNTCLQEDEEADSVLVFSSVMLSTAIKERIRCQIHQTTGEIFEAAAKGMMVHFQPLPNAFEVFGLDFLVDHEATVHLLEVNAFPDFRQSGGAARPVVRRLWNAVMCAAVRPFFAPESPLLAVEIPNLVLVRDVRLGMR